MLRRGRGSDLQRRSPATDNLQIGGHDAVQVSGVTLTNESVPIKNNKTYTATCDILKRRVTQNKAA